MESWGLHTSVKLNPTLLGAETVRGILNDRLGWRLTVPDRAFEHDIKWDDAVQLLAELEATAKRRGVTFGVKLSNTLEVDHDGRVFDPKEKAMYLSGRPLHALTVELANRLAGQLEGRLPVSFAGGADAFNVPHLLAAGMATVTSCSDLLRPGGYTRLRQYLETTEAAMTALEAEDLPSFICRTAAEREPDSAALTLPPAERTRACAAQSRPLRGGGARRPYTGRTRSSAPTQTPARSAASTASSRPAPTAARWTRRCRSTCAWSPQGGPTSRQR
jgi:putative selenate reductase